MTTVLVDGEPVEVDLARPLSVMIHDGELNIEVPGHISVDPEATLHLANTLERWDEVRNQPNFLLIWRSLWDDVPPPQDLKKASLALRHSVGLILLLVGCKVDKLSPHIKYPETYLHPKQCARIMTMVYTIFPNANRGTLETEVGL